MSGTYEEVLAGESVLRSAPGTRHETICSRLHALVAATVEKLPSTRLLPARTEVRVNSNILLRPDLSLVTAATGKLWLAVEVVSSEDHRYDTVLKKQIYDEIKVPRLWMVDPRYDNVEVYHATEHGLKLMGILAGREILTEKLLPQFEVVVAELFAPAPNSSKA